MKLTDNDIKNLTIDAPTEEIEKLTSYGNFGDSRIVDNDLDLYKELIREQAIITFEEINRLRDEVPIAICFWEKPLDNKTIRVGWTGWTDKKRQASIPL